MAQTLKSPETATATALDSAGWLDRFARGMARVVTDAITAAIIGNAGTEAGVSDTIKASR